MVSNIFRVRNLNIHLGYERYSSITKECMDNGCFTYADLLSSKISSDSSKRDEQNQKKIYKAICNYLENIAATNYDNFIEHYYNSAYYNKSACENISYFLDGVGYIYKNIGFIPDSNRTIGLLFPFGKVFRLCYNAKGKGNYMEVIIDVNNISCFWGSLDSFYIHFKNGFSIKFHYGVLTIYMDVSYCDN